MCPKRAGALTRGMPACKLRRSSYSVSHQVVLHQKLFPTIRARPDPVSRNGPRDCAKSVTPTVEIIELRVSETDPPSRYRVSQADEAPRE